jgi:ATP/maltotriose-dependent transcriptional regulator MalT
MEQQRIDQLSRREREVLRLLAAGQTNLEIAQTLTIAIDTVKMHTKHIYNKLNVRNRVQATIRAGELHLLEPERVAAVRSQESGVRS